MASKVKLLTLLVLICSYSSLGAFFTPFSETVFKELQEKGDAILIDVYASWCSICKEQSAVLEKYQKEHPGSKLHILRVDFDTDRKWVRYFKAPSQSTLLLYLGDKQVWFDVGETSESVIFKELNVAMGDKK